MPNSTDILVIVFVEFLNVVQLFYSNLKADLKARISYKVYSEPLEYAFYSNKDLIDGFCNFIQNPLSAL